MPPTELAYTYCTEADLQAVMGVDGTTARVDDDGDNAQSVAEAGYLTKAISWATDRCNFYLLPRYPADRLATSWMVNEWCVCCSLYWLSQRRGNPPPGATAKFYELTVEEMKLVHSGQYEVPGIGTREVLWPAWSNVRVDQLYTLRKIRVERPLSEQTPVGYRQNVDWLAQRIWEP